MTILTALIMLALLATVVSLFWGVGSMAFGGQFDDKHSNHFMSARVMLQMLVIVLLLMTLLVSGT